MSPSLMRAFLQRRRADAAALLGAAIPDWFPDQDDERVLRLRVEDMEKDPEIQSWLLRALVRREPARALIGHAGFHSPPGEDGRAELGYLVFPAFRRQGYASEAVRALMDWAGAKHGVGRFRAAVSPGNEPSLALIRRLGFVQTGEQWDDEDGLELVFELDHL